MAHFVGHRGEQNNALLVGHVTAAHQPGQQDLDVDFVVGAIDAGRVVNGIGKQVATTERKLDTPLLRKAKVAAFADDLDAQLVGIDTQVVVAAIVGVLMTLAARFDVGTDAAVVEKVSRRFENKVHQFGRRHLFSLNAKPFADVR